MSIYHDWMVEPDGHPFEVAKPEQGFLLYRSANFALKTWSPPIARVAMSFYFREISVWAHRCRSSNLTERNRYSPIMDEMHRFQPIPQLDKLVAALRKITEILALELTVPTDRPPDWDDFEWSIARAVATMQGEAQLLLVDSSWKGPSSWHQFLHEQRDHVAGRHRRIEQLLNSIGLAANRHGVALLPLKGAALHSIGIYKAGERPMADVDLLVRCDDVKATTQLLEDLGFEVTFSNWRHQLFEQRLEKSSVADLGEHIDNPIKIELHTSVRERLPVSETDITHFLFPPVPHPGLNDYRSTASLMMHLLLHAAGNMRAHALRVIQLHDIARLGERLARRDWDELLLARPGGQPLWWAAAPLMLTARYYPAAIPPFVNDCLYVECHWFLRRTMRRQSLADVSWSNIRVYAFPGIEWSRTPCEALRFIATRIWPSRDARAELRRFAMNDPGASKIPWYGISQRARILRWIFSRPLRVQTLLAVHAALAKSE
jgi:hypothetical protein